MATPTITTDLTPISDCDSTSGWTIVGMGGIDTEIQVQGGGCLYIEAKSTDALQGAMFDLGTPIDLSGSDRLYFYLFLAARGFLYSRANGGVSVRMEDSSGYWAEWDIGGNDVLWCGEGWHRIVQDANQTPDETGGGGTFDPSDVKEVGFSCWYTAQLKGPAAAIDAVHYGTYVEVTGGTSGDPLTLQDIVDNDTNGYGFVYTNKSGVYEIVSQLYIGDISGASNTYFKTTNERIMFTDQFIPAGETKVILAEDAGTTEVFFGESDGSGDAKVGYAGSLMYAVQDLWGLAYGLDFSASVTKCLIFGSNFQNAEDKILLSAASADNEFISNTINASGRLESDDAIVRNCVISATIDTTGAFLWMTNTDIKNSKFLVNTIGPATFFDTAGVSYSFIGLEFSGNTVDVENSVNATTTDSYSESNQDTDEQVGNGTITAAGQSFTGDGNVLSRVRLWLKKVGTLTGTAVCKIYAATGTDPNQAPTGAVLATSETIVADSVGTSYAIWDFEFEDEFTLVDTTEYFLVLEYNLDSSNYLVWGSDRSSPPAGSNYATYTGSWSAVSAADACFYIYTGAIVKIGLTGSDPAVDDNSGTPPGATIMPISVTLTITVKRKDTKAAIEFVEVAIFRLDNDLELMNEQTNASGIATEPYVYPGSEVDVYWRVREIPSADPQFSPESSEDQITADGLSQTVFLENAPYVDDVST